VGSKAVSLGNKLSRVNKVKEASRVCLLQAMSCRGYRFCIYSTKPKVVNKVYQNQKTPCGMLPSSKKARKILVGVNRASRTLLTEAIHRGNLLENARPVWQEVASYHLESLLKEVQRKRKKESTLKLSALSHPLCLTTTAPAIQMSGQIRA